MSLIYAGGVVATARSNIMAHLATLFVLDTSTGKKSLDKPALEAWIRSQMLLDSAGSTAYDPKADVALLAAALELPALGYVANLMEPAAVTATAVAAKKAELESLGLKIDAYFETLAVESNTALTDMVSEMLSTMDLRATMPEVTTRVVDSRFYVTTWVTNWGEESSPSPPTDLVEVDQNDVCVVTPDLATLPAGRGVVGWRMYRSNSGSGDSKPQMVPDLALVSNPVFAGDRESVVRQIYTELGHVGMSAPTQAEVDYWVLGSAGWTNAVLRTTMINSAANIVLTDGTPTTPSTRYYESVKETAKALQGGFSNLKDGVYDCFKLTSTSYSDAAKSAQLQEVLATTTWLPPPAGLRGMTAMANGITAGFVDNAVCFSEAYIPYAWPVEYQVTVDYPVVAIAAFGTSLFVGTRGSVHLISGSDPSSMSSQIMPGGQSCSSARSVVATDGGVLFASPEGICVADMGGVRVLTAALFTRTDWTRLQPSSMMGMLHDGTYYFTYDTGVQATDVTLTPTQVVAKTYADIKQVPTTPESNFWITKQIEQGWSNYTLRLTMLQTAASFVSAQGYKTQATAAIDLLNRTPTQTVMDTYTEIGRVGATAPTQGEIDFWVAGQGKLALTNVELRLAMLNAAAVYKGSLDADLANEALRNQTGKGCYALDMATGKLTQFDLYGTAFYRDALTDTIYLANGTAVSALFAAPNTKAGFYRTPVMQTPKQNPMAWLQVDGDWSVPATVVWIGDGLVRHTVTLTGPEPVRLPPGRYREHELMLLTASRVTKVSLASTTEELQNV